MIYIGYITTVCNTCECYLNRKENFQYFKKFLNIEKNYSFGIWMPSLVILYRRAWGDSDRKRPALDML